MKLTSLIALIMAVGFMTCNTAVAQTMQCENLKSIHAVNTTISSAETVAAGAFKAPTPAFPGIGADYSKLPAFCRVSGTIRPTPDSDIRFELWLPIKGWNGRFMQTGNGGAAGAIVYTSLADPLTRGYAVANTDTGHQGGAGDFSWAAGHPERLTDYAYRAVHELTIVGKVITVTYYGKSPRKSYWDGCSTGGRQGLMEAQRYPNDYDAIIAGSAASNWTPLTALSVVIHNNLGPGKLGLDKLNILRQAALDACDATDGVKDNVISNPATCHFDPGVTQCKAGQTEKCLSAEEVAAARRIYAGVVDSKGKVWFPGTGPASEQLWGAYATPQFDIGTSYFRYVVTGDPDWNSATFDADKDMPMAEKVDGGKYTAMDPDLSAFFRHGGKLITYHGTADGLIPYRNSVNYFNSVIAKLGKRTVHKSARLYLVPGMSHCSGGDGAFAVDWLTAMENWVEKRKAPMALPGTHPAMPAGGPPGMAGAAASHAFTRPICPYPKIPRYQGGDADKAASFECKAP